MPGKHSLEGPLLIRVHLDSHGAMYSLDPSDELRIQAKFPEARGLIRVFYGYENDSEFPERHRALWEQAATLVTGLTPEQLGQFGGVRFYRTLTDETVWEWHPSSGEKSTPRSRVKTG